MVPAADNLATSLSQDSKKSINNFGRINDSASSFVYATTFKFFTAIKTMGDNHCQDLFVGVEGQVGCLGRHQLRCLLPHRSTWTQFPALVHQFRARESAVMAQVIEFLLPLWEAALGPVTQHQSWPQHVFCPSLLLIQINTGRVLILQTRKPKPHTQTQRQV